ncbi:MAG: hypothetical protein A2622_12750 [Bdellovibrionales bacterium RIFCSPHIGHO2_01_FULL_40_29]|nr:MAG: hypothetical protein A2622_12750 [Bdellovibrionales bacterium RIFCSPHIGHO2_01_FULL_40_29]OFZ33436.1 MAG: hypothetical protein A3D17_14135 [Bdellovibrionales bacterium RIFCSPHIGHO2_02_FULL_40_15]
MSTDLTILLATLEELPAVQSNELLVGAFDEIVTLNNFRRWDIDPINYQKTSSSLMKGPSSEGSFINLKKASEKIKFPFQRHTPDDFFNLNQEVLGLSHHRPRIDLNTHLHPFPHPDLILEGLEAIQNFLFDTTFHDFFSRVAFVQALNSLHPFEDGNGRCSRLLLEHWLIEMGLPPLLCRSEIDFLCANPTTNQKYSLEAFSTSVLLSLERKLLSQNKTHSK